MCVVRFYYVSGKQLALLVTDWLAVRASGVVVRDLGKFCPLKEVREGPHCPCLAVQTSRLCEIGGPTSHRLTTVAPSSGGIAEGSTSRLSGDRRGASRPFLRSEAITAAPQCCCSMAAARYFAFWRHSRQKYIGQGHWQRLAACFILVRSSARVRILRGLEFERDGLLKIEDGSAVQEEVAPARNLPFVALLGENCANNAQRAVVREHADNGGVSFDLLVDTLERVRGPGRSPPMPEVDGVGSHVALAAASTPAALSSERSSQQLSASSVSVGLDEGHAGESSDHLYLPTTDLGQDHANEVGLAARQTDPCIVLPIAAFRPLCASEIASPTPPAPRPVARE